MGTPDFYGRGPQFAVNTLEPMKVVTQFITSDGTDDGDLVDIKRFYVQNGNIIHSPSSTILGPDHDTDSITDAFCFLRFFARLFLFARSGHPLEPLVSLHSRV